MSESRLLLASWTTHIWHLLPTQGLTYGLGSSTLYLPLISVLPEYLGRCRNAAVGINAVSRALKGVWPNAFEKQNVLVASLVGSTTRAFTNWPRAGTDGRMALWMRFVALPRIPAGSMVSTTK
ncbi:hypothetical protein N7G274_004843 [Stereocaulon virgatum]|uniref:Uncharacterized protein n=1 Tax=Stereocaulon virgatum TaxID=373712 RepID=A0ABR4AA60_9LECA